MTDMPSAGVIPSLPNEAPGLGAPVPTAPVETKKKVGLGLLLVLILVGAGVMVVGVMMNEGMGPFAPPVDDTVTAKKPKRVQKKRVRDTLLEKEEITVGTANEGGIVPVVAATRAEIEGYRSQIGKEQKDDVVGPARHISFHSMRSAQWTIQNGRIGPKTQRS